MSDRGDVGWDGYDHGVLKRIADALERIADAAEKKAAPESYWFCECGHAAGQHEHPRGCRATADCLCTQFRADR